MPFTHILLLIQKEVGKSRSFSYSIALRHFPPNLYFMTHFVLHPPPKAYVKRYFTFIDQYFTFEAVRLAPERKQKPLKFI